jgi:C4-dicarboxylate-binding protein DctP
MDALLGLLRGVGAALALAVAAHAADPAPPIPVRFSLIATEDSPRGHAAARFKEVAERLTHGRVHVEIYPDSSLYVAHDELEALQLGAVEVACANLHAFSALGLSDFEAFELPYLFASYDAVHRVTDGPVGAALLSRLREKGIEGLAYWDVGFKQWSSKRPVRVPRDIQGLAIRTTFSRVSDAELRAVRAVPQSTAYPDIRPSLISGALDGTELTLPFLARAGLDDVQRFITLSHHAYLGSALVVNRRFWERLPADVRMALAQAAADATVLANDETRREEAAAEAELRQRGRTQLLTLDSAEIALWKQAFLPVHREIGKRMAPGTLDAMYRAAGFKPQ